MTFWEISQMHIFDAFHQVFLISSTIITLQSPADRGVTFPPSPQEEIRSCDWRKRRHYTYEQGKILVHWFFHPQ